MEFREFLQLAQKKQQKRDKEIKRVEEITDSRKKEKYVELEKAHKLRASLGPAREKSHNSDIVRTTTVAPPSTNRTGDSSNKKLPSKKLTESSYSTQRALSNGRDSRESLPSLPRRPSTSNSSPNRKSSSDSLQNHNANPLKNHTVNSVKKHTTIPVEKHVSQKQRVAIEETNSRISTKSSSVKNTTGHIKVKPKLSFLDMLEVAKRNVDPEATKRKAFDDLMPCVPRSKYRASEPRPKPKQSESSLTVQPTKSEFKNRVPQKRPSQSDNSPQVTVANGSIDKAKLRLPQSQNSSVIKSVRTNELSHPGPSIKPKSGIALQLGHPKITKTPQHPPHQPPLNRTQNPAVRPSSKYNQKPESTLSARKDVIPSTKPNKPLQVTSQIRKPSIEERTTNKIKRPLKEPIRSAAPVFKRTLSPVVVRRGIAAQLGMNHAPKPVDSEDSYDDEDDYESADSFIDDSEALEKKEYARVVRDVHAALRFDPRKYKEVNPWDDLNSMEANYRDIEKEEKRSSRLGAIEDAVEFELDLERKRQKMLRAKAR